MAKTIKPLLIVSLATILAACSGHRPIVDPKGQNMANYENDLRECQNLARQVEPGGEALRSGLIAALLGGAIGGIGWGSGSNIGTGAAIGAVTGGVSGGVSGGEKQKDVIRRCLSNRGYNIIG
ncbi:MAG: hypothetical protein Q4G54_01825 [Pelistega sp.]|nr:hypothetical protein [Pelistega sp.]